MTVSSSTSFQFNIGAIIKMAYREATVININQTPNTAQVQAGLDELQRFVMGTQAKGLFARVIHLELVPIQVGIATMSLNSADLDVVGDAMFVPAQGTLAGESAVGIMTRDQYQGITNKATTGRPNRYWPDRTADTVVCNLWPVPSTAETGASIRFQTHRIRANVRDVNATVDYEQYWVDALTTELARRIAKFSSMPADVWGPLRDEAKDKLDECRRMSMQRGNQQFVMSHSTGWRGR